MILVTGAAGKTGRAVIRALAHHAQPVRAFVRTADAGQALLSLGAVDYATGDLLSADDVRAAMRDVRAVYHICPNMHPAEEAMGALVIAAAEVAGIARFVYHSVLHPQVEAMPHHWAKLRVEARLFASALDWTVLQPAAYFQNILTYRETIRATGRYRVPYPVGTRLGMTDLADVAAVAARVLTETGHSSAIYELAGGEILTQVQIARILSDVWQRPVTAAEIPLDEWEDQARRAGLSDYAVSALRAMFLYYARYGFWGNPRVLTMLLGRSPGTLAEALTRAAAL
ncbi:MAG: NmrA family NAD(P)-binding protein [Caldilineaceae bacterium]|nr:NmrA family NAD(P)-binding protein [Caldilineaceae bacterium]MCB9136804.1 NmrA family NAD(P)-binding protein [Caldilineaceae bacterium]